MHVLGTDPRQDAAVFGYGDAALGRRDPARKAYSTVLGVWKDAEPDFAPLAAARKE